MLQLHLGYGGGVFVNVRQHTAKRSDVQCLHRWQKVINPEVVKGSWSKQEDEALVALVAQHGTSKWSAIAAQLPGRIGKQCRERCASCSCALHSDAALMVLLVLRVVLVLVSKAARSGWQC